MFQFLVSAPVSLISLLLLACFLPLVRDRKPHTKTATTKTIKKTTLNTLTYKTPVPFPKQPPPQTWLRLAYHSWRDKSLKMEENLEGPHQSLL